MIIRQFDKMDARACCSIIDACITATAQLSTPARFYLQSKNVPADFYNDVKDDYTLIAELHGHVVGVGALRSNQIHHIYVSPDFQGSGIGESLMLALEAEAEALGIEVIEIDASHESLEFYQHLGYKNNGKSNTNIEHATLEVTKMSKHISKPAGV